MSIIYTNSSSKKRKKPTRKQLELRESFEKILSKYPTKISPPEHKPYSMNLNYRGRDEYINAPSVDTGQGVAAKPDDKVYTGDSMIGIATLHKSNGIPVFRKEDAEDVSKMRRG